MTDTADVLIVGAGPAGMCAALELDEHGVNAVLLDDQSEPGGQIYRAVERSGPVEARNFGKSYARGTEIVSAFRRSSVRYLPRSSLMNLDPNGRADYLSADGGLKSIHPKAVILATGAYERPVPLPGWTLPGVMSVGAAQILAKQSGMVPAGRTVIIGNGPLVWLLAWQYRNLGAAPVAILQPEFKRSKSKIAQHALEFVTTSYFRDGLRYVAGVRRSGVKPLSVKTVSLLGDDRLEAVEYTTTSGRAQRIEADTALLHDGILPNVHLAGAAGCDLVWSLQQQAWKPRVDDWGQTSRPGVYVPGDGAGIAGAQAAEFSGRLSALDALRFIGTISAADRDAAGKIWFDKLGKCRRGRKFVDAFYPPANLAMQVRDQTLICRCEAVAAREVISAQSVAPDRPAHLKYTTRCGMGPCQGRMCAASVALLARQHSRVHPCKAGPPSYRFPVKPLPLRSLAEFETGLNSDPGTLRE